MATSRLRLGELLLARGTCTRAQLLEAWEQKVLYGDRLGTNLLALGHIDEATLAQTLGAQHNVHAGYGKVLRVDKEALKLLPKGLAERHMVVPHHIAERSLFLLMRDPLDAHAIDDVRFKTGLKVVPVAVCEARLWQLLDIHYQARASLRPVALDVRARTPFSEAERTNPSPSAPELVSEEDFQRLYAGIHSGAVPLGATAAAGTRDLDDITSTFGTSSFPPPQKVGAGPGTQEGMQVPPRTGDSEFSEWRERLEHTNPLGSMPEPSARRRAHTTTDPDAGAAAPPIEPFPLVDEASDESIFPFPERQQTLDFHIEVGALRDESPLAFDDATRVLKAAADRDAIGRIVLRAARSKFKRACLLTVFPDRIVGWLGIGEGFEQDRMRDISIPRGDKSVFGLVATSRSHYLGPLARWPLHGAWVKSTGRKLPSSLAVFPILVRGRTVNLLVVDNGHGEHVGTDVGETLILAQQIAGTYEDLLRPS